MAYSMNTLSAFGIIFQLQLKAMIISNYVNALFAFAFVAFFPKISPPSVLRPGLGELGHLPRELHLRPVQCVQPPAKAQ